MSTFTTVDRLRQVAIDTLSIDAQGLRAAIGQLVVATSADHPDARSAARSVRDAAAGATVLLADRIPAGQEAQVLAAEIARHHGRDVAQTLLGDQADELLGDDGKAITREAISENLRQYLDEPEKVSGWVTAQAVVMKNGSLKATQYFKTTGGGLILRSALENDHPESHESLWRRFESGERFDVSGLELKNVVAHQPQLQANGGRIAAQEPSDDLRSIVQASDIRMAPTDRVLLTECGVARYVDQRRWGSPVDDGWYLCNANGDIPTCAEAGMSISAISPQTWVDFGPLADHLISGGSVEPKNAFVTSETVHRGQVSWRWSDRKLHDLDYQIKVSDAVNKAVKVAETKHGVKQNMQLRCQWEGVEFEGDDLAGVTAAANDVSQVLARFKDAEPLPFNVQDRDDAPSPGM